MSGKPGPSAAAVLPELPVTFRPVRTRVVLLTVGAGLLVVLTAVALMMPSDGAQPWGPGDRATMIITGLLIFALLAVLSRPKVVADDDGITVVNLVASRRLEWAEVVKVNLRTGDPWVYLDLTDGTSLAAMGIQPGGGRDQAVRAARQLRALAEARGTGQPGTR
ncbi:PH domain-containing protein [Streptomyces sp. SID13666]|uniref:PH domain-containing protein n=1 Tax=Streptomyces TaxID=1883 RepID=UPI001105E4C5|nr:MULTISPECIES: PH domain-containing protein [Streptomyces]MCZ4100550.1 PH domain-containing protein [Streptomyces sp. H39-C1]NEA60039.1 PH domain-containing protein [Streptomyces sp. SID13666]NEA76275.1 PH domain-containing protein [Streptomyces sp. SID13588]QNA72339.1 PH domain-containing protein [Streptomyces sp. So13.3]